MKRGFVVNNRKILEQATHWWNTRLLHRPANISRGSYISRQTAMFKRQCFLPHCRLVGDSTSKKIRFLIETGQI